MVNSTTATVSLEEAIKGCMDVGSLNAWEYDTFVKMCADERLEDLWQDLPMHFPMVEVCQKVKVEYCSTVVHCSGLPPEAGVQEVLRIWEVLRKEAHPEYNQRLMQVLGLPTTPVESSSQVVEGTVWGTHKGVEVRIAPKEFTGLWGTLVGHGKKDQLDSIFTRELLPSLNKEVVKHMLTGRRLYVVPGNEEWAKELINTLGLKGGATLGPSDWTEGLRKLFSKPLSLNLAGVMLKTMALHRPGHLGSFTRSFLCCALETFQRPVVELLPLALPPNTAEESELILQLTDAAFSDGPLSDEDLSRFEDVAGRVGVESWLWLQILVINALYCGGGTARPLTETMVHPSKWTDAQRHVVSTQRHVVSTQREYAEAWIASQTDKMVLGEWDQLSEDLGHIYTGSSVGKSYPLTLEAILPTTPGVGEAARIDLSQVVSEDLKPFVVNPDLLRIPDEELVHPRTSAAVQVSSQAEWDRVVAHLVQAQMLEREKSGETLKYKGAPVRNGAFGVHKAWVLRGDQTWLRSLRLIINLIPANTFQRRVPSRPSQKMGYGPSWGSLYLHDDEVLLCCAEDQKHCFHIYRPGYAWRGYFVLNRKASGAAFQDGDDTPSYPRVKSAPMGWNNVVDFIQDGFEAIAHRANLDPGRIVKMGEPSPSCPLVTPRDFFSFYVDNFDQFKVVWQSEVGIYEGKPSDEQLALREEMASLGIGRDPKKAAESNLKWSSLGAEVDGEKGWVGSSLKFRRALLGANLKIIGEDKTPCFSLNLQSVVSKNMHSVQYKRCLAALFDRLYVEMNREGGHMLSTAARDELFLLSMSLPLHWMSQRAKIEGQIFATDASEDGGGACASTGLTKWGFSRVHTLSHEGGGSEGQAADPLVVVECFAGIGGLKQALDLLGVTPQGIIAVENDPLCTKVIRQQTRHVVHYQKIEEVTYDEVKQWRIRFPRAKKVLIGGGWPCINHSQLNPRRQGTDAASSQLLDRMLEVRDHLKSVSHDVGLPDWEVLEMYENVVMDAKDYKVQTQKIGFGGLFLEAAMAGRVRRPRIYWLKNLP